MPKNEEKFKTAVRSISLPTEFIPKVNDRIRRTGVETGQDLGLTAYVRNLLELDSSNSQVHKLLVEKLKANHV